jgi:hypothetical protein
MKPSARLTANLGFRLAAGLLVLWLGSLAPHPARAGSPATTLRVLPATGTYAVGTVFEVEVLIEDVAGLYGADISLAFDPARLAVVDADAGTSGVQIRPHGDFLTPDLVLHREADNAAGSAWYVVTQLKPSEPVTGTGVLFSFQAQALTAGMVTIEVDQYLLSDRDGGSLPAALAGAVYTVTAGYALRLPLVSRP